jgi:hypothetical protein
MFPVGAKVTSPEELRSSRKMSLNTGWSPS